LKKSDFKPRWDVPVWTEYIRTQSLSDSFLATNADIFQSFLFSEEEEIKDSRSEIWGEGADLK
jgi:hypothetical protein